MFRKNENKFIRNNCVFNHFYSSFGKDQTPDYASVTRKLYFDKYQEKYGDGNDKTDLKVCIYVV